MNLKTALHLAKTYIRVHWKLFFIGLSLGILGIYFLPQIKHIPQKKQTSIAIVGNHTIETLPLDIQKEISFGLTRLDPDQSATSGAALSWSATDSGKIMVFKLDPNLFWQDGTKFDTSQVNYSLKGVSVKPLSLSEIQFKFKAPFAPLPAIVSQPIFKNGLIGLGDNKLKSLKFNGKFLSVLTLENQKTGQEKIYKFYPAEKDAILALKLGAVTKVQGVHKPFGLENDKSFTVKVSTDSATVATLFLNHNKNKIDQKAFRQALAYGLPDKFNEGDLAFALVRKGSWADGNDSKKYLQNTKLAEEAFGKNKNASAKKPIVIKTTAELQDVAKLIAKTWAKQGQPTKVELTETIPQQFDAYLTYLSIPPDPDQYALWHSTQKGNLSSYNSPKVDKLLEEGRQTISQKERKRIYAEFQKALSEDLPAIFLFYPKIYAIERK